VLAIAVQSTGEFTMTPTMTSGSKPATDRLFVLDAANAGRMFSNNTDGSDAKTVVTGMPLPDGLVIDHSAGHIYWTNMGSPKQNDGSIERVDLDGRNRTVIVSKGRTFTPKQMQLDKVSRELYWCDREGMRIMRCNLDGSNLETFIDTSGGDSRPGPDATKWCVGITLDPESGKLYWTQKGPDNAGLGRIFRASMELSKGESPAKRTDIELLFDQLPEPIDLEIDLQKRVLYWTDRGDPPRGNTVNRAPVDKQTASNQPSEILVTHLMEGIGIALDIEADRMFMTDLGGSV
jgi:DNA-binding beta-propeller fold protein YncE